MTKDLIERLRDAELSLATYDAGHSSEYWLRHPEPASTLSTQTGETGLVGWRSDMENAPRDRTHILGRVGSPSEKYAHLKGRWFVIWHEGVTASGYDMGWALYPGFGGISDDWFDAWAPLPLMTPPPDLLPCPSKEARELLPCPLCEGEAFLQHGDPMPSGEPFVFAWCGKCGARSRNCTSDDDAVAAWNLRSRHYASTVDVEEALRVQTDVALYEALKDLLSVDDIKRQIWSTDMSSKKRDKMLQSNDGHRKIAEDKARAALTTFKSSRLGVRQLRRRLEAAWTDFLDANPDDLNSPEDLPDHALVTCEQMIEIVEAALDCDSDGNSKAGETAKTGSTVGDSAGRQASPKSEVITHD